jgi:hypothetical protein
MDKRTIGAMGAVVATGIVATLTHRGIKKRIYRRAEDELEGGTLKYRLHGEGRRYKILAKAGLLYDDMVGELPVEDILAKRDATLPKQSLGARLREWASSLRRDGPKIDSDPA